MGNYLGLKKASLNSILLAFYMLLIVVYYLFSSLRLLAFPMLICLSFVTLYDLRKIKFRNRNLIFLFCYFLFSLCIQVANLEVSHFVLFLLAGPVLGFWIYYSTFKISILRYSFMMVLVLLFGLYLKHHSFIGVFANMSENYVSVLMICNVILLAGLEIKQQQQISIWPAIGGLFLSLLAFGRSGILCSLLLFVLFFVIRLKNKSKTQKYFFTFTLLLGVLIVFVSSYETFMDFINNIELLDKFQEKGLKSPSRGILLKEYFDHINEKTLFFGYKYEENPWFLYYGLNPHNSYLRLHYQIGFIAVLLLIYVVWNCVKMYRRNFTLCFMLLVLMLRAYTDSFLFFGLYDFLVFFMIFNSSDTLNHNGTNLCKKNI